MSAQAARRSHRDCLHGLLLGPGTPRLSMLYPESGHVNESALTSQILLIFQSDKLDKLWGEILAKLHLGCTAFVYSSSAGAEMQRFSSGRKSIKIHQ